MKLQDVMQAGAIAPVSSESLTLTQKIGLVLSFTLKFDREDSEAAAQAEQYLEEFHMRVCELANEEFPQLYHTMSSKQIYEP